MVGSQGAARFTDDVRHRQLVLPARFSHRVDHVVRVLLERVVHARLRRRVAAVVINAETAADIDVSDVDTQPPQLRVVPRHFLQTGFDVADVSDLRAQVKVDQLEDVEPAFALEPIDELHQLRRAEAELRLLATALCPTSRSFGVKLDANARGWSNAELVGDLKKDVHLAQLLEHYEHLVSEFLTHQGQAHEL